MKKLLVLFLLLILLPLSSCNNREVVEQTSTYVLPKNLNINIETGSLTIKLDDTLDEDSMQVYYKYESEESYSLDSYYIHSESGVSNSVIITINPSSYNIFSINIESYLLTLVIQNVQIDSLTVSSPRLDLSISNLVSNDIKLESTQSYSHRIVNVSADTLTITSDKCNNLWLEKNTITNIDINITNSQSHIYRNSFEIITIYQLFGKIDGAFLDNLGYTINCEAENIISTDMRATDNVYGDGSSEINFTVTNGEIVIWVV